MYLNRKALTAQLSLRDDLIRQPVPSNIERIPGEWDDAQERADKEAAEKEKEVASGRPNRVINHPLFFNMNAATAEEYLGTKEPGELVIRPSSKGFDHLVVTWKVSNSAYQHLDVLELGKETEYSIGKQLRVGKATYTDLDELIVNHVEAMARKVAELTRDERFQQGTKEDTGMLLSVLNLHNMLTQFRTVARELLQSQPQSLHVRLLQHAQAPRLLLDLFPDGLRETQGRLGYQGRTQCI